MGIRAQGNPIASFLDVWSNTGLDAVAPAPDLSEGLTATGGIISDYIDPSPGKVYRAHIFTSSGTFDVTASGTYGDTVEYLVVGGGGGGGGGGGSNTAPAGGGRLSLPAFLFALPIVL